MDDKIERHLQEKELMRLYDMKRINRNRKIANVLIGLSIILLGVLFILAFSWVL